MAPDCEDVKTESIYPSEVVDLENVDKMDGDCDDLEESFEMPKISLIAKPKESYRM